MRHDLAPTLRAALTALAFIAGLTASADELDDQVNKACTGISARFNSASTKHDAVDDEIGKAVDGSSELKALLTRAGFTGSARACGSDTKAAEAKLDATAGTLFQGNAAKAKRLVQILHCIEARTTRDAGAHWGSQQYCTTAQRNFDNYVTHEQTPP